MPEWLDLSTILNSALGSIIVGLLFLSSAPVWWTWLKLGDTTKLRKKVQSLTVFAVLLGVLVPSGAVLDYFERTSIPPHHPTLTDKEAALAFSECEMKSVEATSVIISRSDRTAARHGYRAACLLSKGFEWAPREEEE